MITTVDALNATLHLSRNPESIKQIAAADWLMITKTDLADPAQAAAVRTMLGRLNPSAELLDAFEDEIDVDRLLAPRHFESPPGEARLRPLIGVAQHRAKPAYLEELHRHSAQVASLSLALEEPLDWTAFGIWLSMLLNRHGDDVLRVKGILQVQGMSRQYSSAVQHRLSAPTSPLANDVTDRALSSSRDGSHALALAGGVQRCRVSDDRRMGKVILLATGGTIATPRDPAGPGGCRLGPGPGQAATGGDIAAIEVTTTRPSSFDAAVQFAFGLARRLDECSPARQ